MICSYVWWTCAYINGICLLYDSYLKANGLKVHRIKTGFFLVSFLFLSVLIVGFVFACTDAEYNYNQQIARGFISKDAVFFSIDDLSYREALYFHYDFSADEDIQEPLVIDTTPKKAKDPSFVLTNKTLENGLTAVETMLVSGDQDYMAAIHNGVMRGVVYKGDITLPPLISGRFFSEDECLSDVPRAVIGRKMEGSTTIHEGKKYLDYLNKEYEVIGIAGLSGESPMDDMVFVNLGSLTSEEQLIGTYYIDCGKDNEAIYNVMSTQSTNLFGCGLKRREIPMAFIEVVSGGMYMKPYLKGLLILLGIITYSSVLIQSIRENFVMIAVMKVQGIGYGKMFLKTIKQFLTAFMTGTTLGLVCIMFMILSGYFSLPVNWLIRYCLYLLTAGVSMALIWMLTVVIVEWKLDPKRVIQKI